LKSKSKSKVKRKVVTYEQVLIANKCVEWKKKKAYVINASERKERQNQKTWNIWNTRGPRHIASQVMILLMFIVIRKNYPDTQTKISKGFPKFFCCHMSVLKAHIQVAIVPCMKTPAHHSLKWTCNDCRLK
jgi:hypothetical protein